MIRTSAPHWQPGGVALQLVTLVWALIAIVRGARLVHAGRLASNTLRRRAAVTGAAPQALFEGLCRATAVFITAGLGTEHRSRCRRVQRDPHCEVWVLGQHRQGFPAPAREIRHQNIRLDPKVQLWLIKNDPAAWSTLATFEGWA